MESRTFLVYLSDSLIRYLGKSLPNKASRYEAFQYIIGKQKEKIDLDRDGGANVPFLAKVSDLAKRWNWSRNTVFSFLKTLQDEGLIEVKQCADGTLIHVVGIYMLMPRKTKINGNLFSSER